MDLPRARLARDNFGLLTSRQLGDHPSRSAERAGLVAVQPRVWIAETQPVGAAEQVAALQASVQGAHALLDLSALWKYGLWPEPAVIRVGVLHSTRFRVRPPTKVRRLVGHLLEGRRTIDGASVVALEVAVVQAAAHISRAELLALVEDVLRRRLTTIPRLRARCRRGVAGSAATRRSVDELVGVSLDRAVRALCEALEARAVTGLRTEVRFTNAAGASAYADVLDEAGGTVLEVDGFLSHLERKRFRADRRRDRWMQAEHEIATLRIDVAEIEEDLPAIADELAPTLLRRRQSRVQPAG